MKAEKKFEDEHRCVGMSDNICIVFTDNHWMQYDSQYGSYAGPLINCPRCGVLLPGDHLQALRAKLDQLEQKSLDLLNEMHGTDCKRIAYYPWGWLIPTCRALITKLLMSRGELKLIQTNMTKPPMFHMHMGNLRAGDNLVVSSFSCGYFWQCGSGIPQDCSCLYCPKCGEDMTKKLEVKNAVE